MAIVEEPCNVNAHAKIPALCWAHAVPRLCVHMYCTTVHTDWDCTVVLLADQSIASIQGTPHTHYTLHTTQTKSNVELGFPD